MAGLRFLTVPLVIGAAAVASTAAFAQNTNAPLRIGVSALGNEALDPVISTALGRIYLSSMYDEIVGATTDGKFVPEQSLATKWESSPDGKQWTLQIRQGVTFHNGAPLTAEDVRFSIMRGIGAESRISLKDDAAAAIVSVEAPDANTVRINLKQPYPGLLVWLGPAAGTTGGMVYPAKYYAEVGEKGFSAKPVGSGPYKFTKQVGGASIEMDSIGRDHWRTGQPKYKTMVWNQVQEETTRVAQLKRGDLDIIDLSRASLKEVTRSSDLAVNYKPGDLTPALYFGQQYLGGLFADERVRKAMDISINRQELLQTIMGGGGRLNGVPATVTLAAKEIGLDPAKLVPEYNPAKARQLLKDAGKEGAAFTVYALPWSGMPEGTEMMEAIGGYWGAIGLKPNILRVDLGAMRKKWRDMDIKDEIYYIAAPSRDWIGQIGYNSVHFRTSSKSTRSVDDPELNAMFDKIDASAANPEAMKEGLRNILLRVIDKSYSASVFELDTPFGYRKATVKQWDLGGLPQNMNIEAVYASK